MRSFYATNDRVINNTERYNVQCYIKSGNIRPRLINKWGVFD
jgi:hypothetical protein